MTTSTDTRLGLRRNFRIDRIEQEDRTKLQEDAKSAVSDVADQVAGAPAQRPTMETAADARAKIAFDPVAQQLMTNLDAQLPTAELDEDGTFQVTGTDGDDRIVVDADGDEVSAYYTDADGNTHLLGSADADDVEQIAIDAGEGDDVVVNTQDDATIHAGEGDDEVYNSGDDVTIAADEDADGSDVVFNAGDDATIDYAGGEGHEVTSIGNGGTIGVAGDGSSVAVVGEGNAVELGGTGVNLSVQGDGNAVTTTQGGNAVAIAGDGNGVDLAGGGNVAEVVGDGNVVVAADDPVGTALDNFDTLDVDGDGFLRPEELAQIPGGDAIVQASDALMFGSIESGNEAWHGVSRADLEHVSRMMAADPSLTVDDVAQQLRETSWLGERLAADGQKVDADSFSAAVAEHREPNEVEAIDASALAPMTLDPNLVSLWGDENSVASMAPNTWVTFAGDGNQVALGGDESLVVGEGDGNQIALAGKDSIAAFAGNMNRVLSDGGNAILGYGMANDVTSYGDDAVYLDGGYNFYNGQLQLPLSPYFSSMGPDLGYSDDEMIRMMFDPEVLV